ncbi:hypothetical protein MA16_Dca021791 [Dendrobium catenatum]|uniref:Transmembrane protein n=1 Tax=Dendrobium catenatum TaxID=906689 RepID=A0A2I0WXW0_9ASPA|nr:hypothetical protein MA16_Dca021791 [Dendrobium catenatum]
MEVRCLLQEKEKALGSLLSPRKSKTIFKVSLYRALLVIFVPHSCFLLGAGSFTVIFFSINEWALPGNNVYILNRWRAAPNRKQFVRRVTGNPRHARMLSLPFSSFPPPSAAGGVPAGSQLPLPCPWLPCSTQRKSNHRLDLHVSKILGGTTVLSSSFGEVSPVSTFTARQAAVAELKESADLEATLSRFTKQFLLSH